MAETKNLGNIKLNNYDTVPSRVTFTAKNNGHTFSVSMGPYTSETVPTISEGGLPGTFNLVGFHFHWGRDSTKGSEHQKDGKSYPAEVKINLTNI